MRRTVKGWMLLIRTRTDSLKVTGTADGAYARRRDALDAVHMVGERVVRCTITYDDGRPRKRAREAK